MRAAKYVFPTGLALAILLNLPVYADDPQGEAQSEASLPADADVSAGLTAPLGYIEGMGVALSLTDLDKHRGGQEIVVNDMKLNGVVANNSASDLFTGANSISAGAFANASGLPMVIQNSGNNVLIQNATIVNVQIK